MVDLSNCELSPGNIGSFAAMCIVLQSVDGELSPDETGAALHHIQSLGTSLDGALELSQMFSAEIAKTGDATSVFLNGARILSDLPLETLAKVYTALEEIAYSDGLDVEREAAFLKAAHEAWKLPNELIGSGQHSETKDWGVELDAKLAERAKRLGRQYPAPSSAKPSGCGLLIVGITSALIGAAYSAF